MLECLYNMILSYYEHVLKENNKRIIIDEIKSHNIKLIDSARSSLCLSMFDWVKFRTAKEASKIHTCWDRTTDSEFNKHYRSKNA